MSVTPVPSRGQRSLTSAPVGKRSARIQRGHRPKDWPGADPRTAISAGNPLYFLKAGLRWAFGRGRAFYVAASRWHLLPVQVRTYADLPAMISVPSRYLPLTAFRGLLFGSALSLALAGSPLWSSRAHSRHLAPRQVVRVRHPANTLQLFHDRNFSTGALSLSPLQVGLSSVSQLRFSCSSVRFPRHIARQRFNRVVDDLLTGVREGQVHASDAIVRFFLSKLVVRRARSPG